MIGCHPYRDECFLWDRFPGYRCARPGANGFNASGVELCATSKLARQVIKSASLNGIAANRQTDLPNKMSGSASKSQ